MTAQELTAAREGLGLLRAVAESEIKQFLCRVAPVNYVAILADSAGIAVDVEGTRPIDSDISRLGVRAGAVWSEPFAGTSGIGTSLVERRALTIRRNEHYFHAYAGLTCMAAPIRDWNGEILATLDVSSMASLSEDTLSFVLELIEATARRIERRHFFARNAKRPILRVLSRVDDMDGDSMLFALGDDGRVVECLGSEPSMDRTDLVGCLPSGFMEINWDGPAHHARDSGVLERIGIARLRGLEHPCFASLKTHMGRSAGKRAKQTAQRAGALHDIRLTLDTLAGGDPTLRSQTTTIKRLADRRLPILLQGETGTGKEEFARAIHNAGSRSLGPFVAIDCSSIPESLVESELFGYETGTFTGGRREGRRGRIVEANNGTLFLDEIGDMPLTLQTRLLRVLARREVVPLGGAKPIPVDFNVICASHQDLPKMVKDGRFRQDLFFRIAGVRLELPPLRKRQDKERIISQALAIEAAEMGISPLPVLSPAALGVLMAQTWPGNIRELRLAVRYALAKATDDEIHPDDLPSWLDLSASTPGESGDAAPADMEDMPPSELVAVLARHNWCVSDAAATLKINRRTLHRWMRRHSILRPNQV
ncbi:sigma-54-dependent Fis family transcriptional regulator [Hyphomicrobium sp.]|uniref:sigma-54-dependent Fis family transcriptional regulator n=1 Tax=Hyphomicrobium sp. TaxID=82 RepID=UPI0025C1CF58|nr:sigma-54-dependent Fis family transcriptional regulator [Hyphomicrobium sp.]MCC7254131.1 sigma-54-dependent Fis family transcriptional regulator [Hyphomicrobium sp.]